jgi:hypothetical protein
MSDKITKAFPFDVINRPGMDLRDYFAAKFAQALAPSWGSTDAALATRAYVLADALMTAKAA